MFDCGFVVMDLILFHVLYGFCGASRLTAGVCAIKAVGCVIVFVFYDLVYLFWVLVVC